MQVYNYITYNIIIIIDNITYIYIQIPGYYLIMISGQLYVLRAGPVVMWFGSQ